MKVSQEFKSVLWALNAICLGEMKAIVHAFKGQDGSQSAPYIKFLLIVNGIEFLGACLDELPIDENKRSEERFNNALNKLFEKKYHKYSKANAEVYFYRDLRCGMVHQLRPRNIGFTTQNESKVDGTIHLVKDKGSGMLVLVLEEFYDDFEFACKKLIKMIENGKVTNKKSDKDFITLTRYLDNDKNG